MTARLVFSAPRPSDEWVAEARARQSTVCALYAGQNAFGEGLAADANPFLASTERALHDEWAFGWNLAQGAMADRGRAAIEQGRLL